MSISTRRNSWMSQALTLGAILAVSSLGLISPVAAQDNGPQRPQAAAGSGFTYQGRLVKNGQPVNGLCALSLSLWDAASGGGSLGSNTFPTLPITNGLFTVQLDYGTSPFVGEARWIETAVQCPGDGSPVTLSPRTRLTAAPYALYALNNWALNGNSGTGGNGFVGTTDNMSLTIGVNGAGALRIYPAIFSPNLIGGYSGNYFTPTIYGATIAGGGSISSENRVLDNFGTVGGGLGNQAAGYAATIAGGLHNTVSGWYSAIGGGLGNDISGDQSAIGGGDFNTVSGWYSAIGGGYGNTVSGYTSTIGGGQFNAVNGDWSVIGGGDSNTASGLNSAIGGGFSNTVSGWYSVIGGGFGNAVSGGNSAIGGGFSNDASGFQSAIGGGYDNIVTGWYSAIGGGLRNDISGDYSTIGGGDSNTVSAYTSTIGGGSGNTASGIASTVPGGENNLAKGAYSFAAGRRAKAENAGCFAWADSSDIDFRCGVNNSFTARATGGVYFVSAIDGTGAATAGVILPIGGNAWAALSDKNSKANFAPIDSRAVMEKLARIPISTWNYKTQDEAIRHIGPMAQDFAAAFNVGEDDKHITTIDADGVSLAALQGLYQIVQEKDQRISQLEREVAQLKQGSSPDQPFNFSNVVSLVALVGVALMALGLRRKAAKAV